MKKSIKGKVVTGVIDLIGMVRKASTIINKKLNLDRNSSDCSLSGGAILKNLAWIIVGFGVISRIVRYLANRSLWGDEAYIAINLIDRSFQGLMEPLAFNQVAPVGFLALEKIIILLFGHSEYALRAFPLIAGLSAMAVFYVVVSEALEEQEVVVAMMLFAISESLIFYSSELKQYSSDVLVCLVIILPALRIVRNGMNWTRLAMLATAGTVGVWFSLSAVFVCGGVGFTLLIYQFFYFRRASAVAKVALVTVLWALSFAIEYFWVLRSAQTNEYLVASWAGFFAPMPGFSADCFKWYRKTFFSIFNDPTGLPSMEIAAVIFLVGLVRFWQRNRLLLIMLLSPIGLLLIASILGLMPFPTNSHYHLLDRYYPFYGRIILFTVPLLISVLACGCTYILGFNDRRYHYFGRIIVFLLIAMPTLVLFLNMVSPPKIQEMRPLLEQIETRYQNGDKIYVQTFSRQIVEYYTGLRGMEGVSGEFTARENKYLLKVILTAEAMNTGSRFWFITLHHPHWKSDTERQKITDVLKQYGDELEHFKSYNGEASLYRIR